MARRSGWPPLPAAAAAAASPPVTTRSKMSMYLPNASEQAAIEAGRQSRQAVQAEAIRRTLVSATSWQ
jgi:hypothetical protein